VAVQRCQINSLASTAAVVCVGQGSPVCLLNGAGVCAPPCPGCRQNDEVVLQRKVRTEVFQLEDTLAQVRKEYEMLRIEFEQTLAANEQAGRRPRTQGLGLNRMMDIAI